MIFLIVRFFLFSWMLRYLNLLGSPTEQRFNDAEGDEEEGAAEDKEAGDDDEENQRNHKKTHRPCGYTLEYVTYGRAGVARTCTQCGSLST